MEGIPNVIHCWLWTNNHYMSLSSTNICTRTDVRLWINIWTSQARIPIQITSYSSSLIACGDFPAFQLFFILKHKCIAWNFVGCHPVIFQHSQVGSPTVACVLLIIWWATVYKPFGRKTSLRASLRSFMVLINVLCTAI